MPRHPFCSKLVRRVAHRHTASLLAVLAALALGATACVPAPETPDEGQPIAAAPERPAFREPRELLASVAASQVVTLEAKAQVEDGKLCLTYSGERPGQTIHTTPGGTFEVKIANRLTPFTAEQLQQFDPPVLRADERAEVGDLLSAASAVTNLHTHGLHLSPSGRSDNVMLKINQGKENLYTLELPGDHAPGTHWYHAHLHGSTALQVQGGMAGALIVDPPPGQSLDPPGYTIEPEITVVQVACGGPVPGMAIAAKAEPSTRELLASVEPRRLPAAARRLLDAKSDDEAAAGVERLEPADRQALVAALEAQPEPDPPIFEVNELRNPMLEAEVGTIKRLRMINAGSRKDDYKKVWLEGGELYLAAFDGVNLTSLPKDASGSYVAYTEENPLELAPGNRADLYFLPTAAGTQVLKMQGEKRARLAGEIQVARQFTQDLMTIRVRARLRVKSDPAASADDTSGFLAALDQHLVALQETPPYSTGYLRPFASAPTLRRTVTFSVADSGDKSKRSFQINGRDYNEMVDGDMQGHSDYLGRVDGDGGSGPTGQTPWPPRTGTEEQWTIVNTSGSVHPFHIHVSPFWVHDITEKNAEGDLVSVRQTNPSDPRLDRWQDTITLPPNGGSVTIWHRFSDYDGVFVVHCHILQHEDRGMMINILLVPADETDPQAYFDSEMAANDKINQEINGTSAGGH